MGARGFEYTVEAKSLEDFKTRFFELAEMDRHDNGHDCYSGDIGQKSHYVMLSSTPVSPSVLETLEQENEGDKWGPAMAAPVKERKLVGERYVKKVRGYGNSRWTALERAKSELDLTKSLIISQNADLLSDPKFKLVPSGEESGWFVTGSNVSSPFKNKSEAKKVYKETLLKTGHGSLIYKDNCFTRVCSREAMWEFTIVLQDFELTEEIAHFKVWGWAAE